MTLPDPSTVRTDPAVEGYHYEWAVEAYNGLLAWRVLRPSEARQCRWRADGERCTHLAVAKLQRGRRREMWWHYCADHMFGRRIDGNRVWSIRMVPDEATRETP